MNGSGRWSSFSAGRENKYMAPNDGGDYAPFEVKSRQAGRAGHYEDVGQSSRMLGDRNAQNEQSAGRKTMAPSAVAHHAVRKEGPNWVLIAGSALATAIGVMIVRKQKPQKPAAVQKSPVVNMNPLNGKDRARQSGMSLATTRQESTGSRTSDLSSESLYSADLFLGTQTQAPSEGSRAGSNWGDDECNPLSPQMSCCSQVPRAASVLSNRTVISPTSPPGSYRGGDTSATECNDPIVLSPPGRLNFSTRRDAVHRLRQQLKSRDEMILDMQTQISEQEQTIGMQQAQGRELEKRLNATCRSLFESDLEVQRLRRTVADYLGGHATAASLDSSVADRRDSGAHQQLDENFLVREAGRLAEELTLREDEKQELEQVIRVKVKEHELLMQRVNMLEGELEEARKTDWGKNLLLEAYEVEQEDFEVKLDSLKRMMENKQPERSPVTTKIGRKSFSGGFGILRQDDEIDENGRSKSDDFRLHARHLVRSCSALFDRTPEQSGMDSNGSSHRHKSEESSSNGDVTDESEAEDSNPPLSEKLVMKLRQDVEQLSAILKDHSDMMSKKRVETAHLVDEFQKHNLASNDMLEQLDQDAEGSPEARDQIWQNHGQCLSFSNDTTSASQILELSHKLERIANQQRVEEEIADLSKHQVKISELKQRVEKLLIRCQKQSNGGFSAAAHQQASKMAAAGFELAKQLELQEEQAKRTSREVQKLLASFELSSPYVPQSKKEELRRMLQSCSSESLSPPDSTHPHDLLDRSNGKSLHLAGFANGSEAKFTESDHALFDPAVSSSAEPASSLQCKDSHTLHTAKHPGHRSDLSRPPIRKPKRDLSSRLRKERSSDSRRQIARAAKSDATPLGDEDGRPGTHGHADDLLDENLLSATGAEDQALRSAKQLSQDDELSTILAPGEDRSSPDRASSSAKSSGGFSNSSSTVRRRSGGEGRHNVTSESSLESSRGSFGKFLFNVEVGNNGGEGDGDGDGDEEEVHSGNQRQRGGSDQSIEFRSRAGEFSLSKPLKTTRSDSDLGKVRNRNSGVNDEGRDRRASRSTTSGSSIDSMFDALLSNTLDDFDLVSSTPLTP